MGRKTRDFHNPGAAVLAFMTMLMQVENPFDGGEHRSNPGSKSECFAFRQRLYAWRYQIFVLMADHNSETYKQHESWLLDKLGPRGTPEWLDCTIFQVEPDPVTVEAAKTWAKDSTTGEWRPLGALRWQVIGRFKRPMAGRLPLDPLETGPNSLAENRAIIEARFAAMRNPPPRPAFSIVEPPSAAERIVPVGALPDFDPENPL